jgi:Zn ribbon nucleic-acid-binding protein
MKINNVNIRECVGLLYRHGKRDKPINEYQVNHQEKSNAQETINYLFICFLLYPQFFALQNIFVYI